MFGIDFIIQSLNFAASFLFALWPIWLLTPLRWRRNSITGMIVAWAVLAVVRVLLVFSPLPILALIVPEPLNTVIFFAAGGVLVLLKLGRDQLQRRNIQKKADDARSVEDLRSLSPKEFEEMVVELYMAMGHKAKRTGATGDHGVDVEVQAANGEKWVVQCKRWRGTVGEPIVRDFHGVMQHEKADKGAIITTGKFTAQAREWASGKPITLLEGEQFLQYLQRVRRSANVPSAPTQPTANAAPQATAAPKCPKCGSDMVLRTAKRGMNAGEQFWGCST